jgi:hypothetical protein
MLVLFMTSFIALNNCGHQPGSMSEQAISPEQNGPASDFIVLPGPPGGYPGFFDIGPVIPIETDCDNGVDDDGDGHPDCSDTDCQVHPQCSEFGPPLEGLINDRTLTVYPNGIIVPEDIVLLKARGADDDDPNGWWRDRFFEGHETRDCFVDPREVDPYFFIPLGEALVAGPYGPIGPQLTPGAVAYYGPRAGLIDICGYGSDIFELGWDDDNGDGGDDEGDDDF